MNDHDPVTVVDRTGTVDRYYVALGQLLTTMEQATAETQKQIDNWKQYQLETSVVRVTPDGANELLAVLTAERDELLAERAKRDDAL